MLNTSRDIPSEIFASLGFLSEISAAGIDFIRARNPQNADSQRTFTLFRAFIRQARTFWEAAVPLHHRAGPLNYYYCFLNLVKAYICLSDPEEVSGRVLHGLAAGDPPPNFAEATLRVQTGVFPLFYKACFHVLWPEQLPMNVLKALGYCGDVSHEYITGGFGHTPRLMGICRLELDDQAAFATVALTQYQSLIAYPETKAKIEAAFDIVDIPKPIIEREFDLLAEEARGFTFLETKVTYPVENEVIPRASVAAGCYAPLRDHYLFVPYALDRLEFSLFPPCSEQPYAPMNEVIAIYVVMYYLSSLVRYHPSYMERMLDSKEGWLVENFALSAPQTFLRHMINLILDEERVYKAL